MNRVIRDVLFRGAATAASLTVFFFLCAPSLAGGTVNIGLITFDTLIPAGPGPGVNAFNISNLTGDPVGGGFALPPDFAVMDSLVLLGSVLTLEAAAGSQAILLGDLPPGSLDPTGLLEFTDSDSFTRATFSATLSQTRFLLSDGSTFTAASPFIYVELLPASGLVFLPGADFAVIEVTDVPEPSLTFVLLVSVALLLATGDHRYRQGRSLRCD